MPSKHLLLIAATVIVLGAAAALVWVVLSPGAVARPGGLLPYDDPTAVARGKSLYNEHCADCHGAKLEGEPNWRVADGDGYLPAPPHDSSGHTWHHPDAQLFAITKHGTEALVGGDYKSRMIGYSDTLSDDEIFAVLAYIKSTWPAQIIARHNQVNAAQN